MAIVTIERRVVQDGKEAYIPWRLLDVPAIKGEIDTVEEAKALNQAFDKAEQEDAYRAAIYVMRHNPLSFDNFRIRCGKEIYRYTLEQYGFVSSTNLEVLNQKEYRYNAVRAKTDPPVHNGLHHLLESLRQYFANFATMGGFSIRWSGF